MSQETIRPPFRVANLHTDGSAPFVHGYTLLGTGIRKDLTRRSNTTHSLGFHITEGPDQGTTSWTANQWDAPRARAGGEKLTVLAAFTCPPGPDGNDMPPTNLRDEYMRHSDVYNRLLQKTTDTLKLITNHTELSGIMGSDKAGIIKSVEGVYGRYTMKDIEEMSKEAKIWTVWWNYTDPRTGADNTATIDTGLTAQGRDFIQTLAGDLHVAVDLSHASDRTSWDVLDAIANIGGVPAIASHSGSREVFDHKRNLPDNLAIAIAQRDGIIGLPATATFNGNFQGVIDTALHFKKIGIVDHIAFGPDFDGMPQHRIIPELKDAEVAGTNLAAGLRQAGFTEKETQGVLFDNSLRYMQTYLFPDPETI